MLHILKRAKFRPGLTWKLLDWAGNVKHLFYDEAGILAGKGITWQSPICAIFAAGPNAALLTLPDVCLFVVDSGSFECQSVMEIHETLGTDGGAVTLDVKKATGTQAATAGTSFLATTFNLKAAINTVVRKNRSNAGFLTTAAGIAARTISAGERHAIDFTGVMTAVSGVNVTAFWRPIKRANW